LSRPKKSSKKPTTSRRKSSWRGFWVISTLFVLACLIGGLAWLQMPMGFKPSGVTSPNSAGPAVLDLTIEPGTSPKGVAQAIADAGADVSPSLMWLWFRDKSSKPL
jgi:UPF0755 protein